MIRILHVVASLNINAGMMSVIMNYYRVIDRTKIQFDFLYFGETTESHQAEIESLGGRVYFMPCRTLMPSDQKHIRHFFQDHKGEYAAIHCHPIWSSSVVSKEARRSGIKHVIQHVHSTKYSEKKISSIRNRILMRFIGRIATDYVACNEDAKQLFGRKIALSGKVAVVPNAIDVKKYTYDKKARDQIRKELDIHPTTLVVGTVGRLSPEKNQLFCLEIFNCLRTLHLDSRMVLVGDGSMRNVIEEKISSLNLQNEVLLTGKRRDVNALLSSFDVFLMPSLFEGTPVSAIEARSSGLPCLLSDSITKSVSMTGITFLSIKSSPLIWAKEVLTVFRKQEEQGRLDSSEVIKCGFDIGEESRKLQKYYMELL